MTQTLTLTDFLLQRIAEDEAEVQNALALHGSGTTWRLGHALDPARMLAECEAKRRIVKGLTQDAPTLHDGMREKVERGAVEWAWSVAREGTLANLALPYADHPDYREEWKP